MDTLKMPLREIRKRYTKSELVIMAWASQEQAYKLRASFDNKKDEVVGAPSLAASISSEDILERIGMVGERKETNRQQVGRPAEWHGLPPKYFNEEGELDLRNVTGAEAVRFFAAQGMKIPFVPK